MARQALTDDEWELVRDVFPPPKPTGRPRSDWRNALDGMLWTARTGSPWRDLPEEDFGPWETVYGLFNQWNSDGTLDEIVRRLQLAHVDVGALSQDLWCVDGTVVRAHRCAAGGGKKGIRRSLATTR
jgi:transposase